jgi:hypothetical protein
MQQDFQQHMQQQQQRQQDVGAFFKSLFPDATVSIASSSYEEGHLAYEPIEPTQARSSLQAAAYHPQPLQPAAYAPQQLHSTQLHQYRLQVAPQALHFQRQQRMPPLPPGFGTPGGSTVGGLLGAAGSGLAAPQLGSSPTGHYDPIAGVIHDHHQQASGIAPGLALLRQLQCGSAAGAIHEQHGSYCGSFSDPAIMALGVRNVAAAPPTVGPSFQVSRPPGF